MKSKTKGRTKTMGRPKKVVEEVEEAKKEVRSKEEKVKKVTTPDGEGVLLGQIHVTSGGDVVEKPVKGGMTKVKVLLDSGVNKVYEEKDVK